MHQLQMLVVKVHLCWAQMCMQPSEVGVTGVCAHTPCEHACKRWPHTSKRSTVADTRVRQK
jgi:hypothetical protein